MKSWVAVGQLAGLFQAELKTTLVRQPAISTVLLLFLLFYLLRLLDFTTAAIESAAGADDESVYRVDRGI